ncbi:MAG: hypothetical protein FJY77_03920, partial [Candidatus Altiarchaeales archaeon]|nr:hypothetical protein [Candidatus Altiarchaeales archaeon]
MALESPDFGKEVGNPAKKAFFSAFDIVKQIVGLVFWGINIIIFFIILFARTVTSVLKLFVIYAPKVIGRFIPAPVSTKLEQLLVYAGVGVTAEDFLSMTAAYSILMSILTYLITGFFGIEFIYRIALTAIMFFGVWIVPRIMLNALVYQRTQNIEGVLPDILDIIAQNIRTGMTTDRALWSAARPEFGPLSVELQIAARTTLTGSPLQDALIAITNRIQSERLERTIRLIIQGITSGGELPEILQAIASDMRTEQNLVKQMKSETNAHVMFILFAILFGAPMLFGVSLQFILVFSGLFSKINVSELSNLPQGATTILLKP